MEHQKKHRRVVARIVTLSGLALGLVLAGQVEPSAAQAADDKIFAPQFCVPIDESGDEIGQAAYRIDRVVQNQDLEKKDFQDFLCPLIREEVMGTLDKVWVRVENENPKDDTPPECCVYSVSLGGSMTDFECETAKDKSEAQSLEIQLKDFTEYDHGHYVVKCELGEDDAILGIRTSEHEADD
jgi:hypothetical protein